ncbi:MAG: Holliday junction resolvase RuvX [Armatimonadota bacterium]
MTKTIKILAIDPGKEKCGIAVVEKKDNEIITIHRSIEKSSELAKSINAIIQSFEIQNIIIGNGTNSEKIKSILEAEGLSNIIVVDEAFTTLEAKELYFKENPPKGIRKLLPISLQTPSCPYDDYVAKILALRYLNNLQK